MGLTVTNPNPDQLVITAPDEDIDYLRQVINQTQERLEAGDPLPVAVVYAAIGNAYLADLKDASDASCEDASDASYGDPDCFPCAAAAGLI